MSKTVFLGLASLVETNSKELSIFLKSSRYFEYSPFYIIKLYVLYLVIMIMMLAIAKMMTTVIIWDCYYSNSSHCTLFV